MKRALIVAGALMLAGFAGWWALRSKSPSEGPEAIPMGETVRQVLPGPDGEPEVWTLSKRGGDPEVVAAPALPAPAPRQTKADENTESARTLNGLALEQWKHGDLFGAIDSFEQAIEQDPDDWLPRADYGRLLVMMTNYAEAGPHLTRAAELRPEDPRVWLDLYSYYERTLQLERALEARQRANELAGGRAIEQDRSGLWKLEGDSVFP